MLRCSAAVANIPPLSRFGRALGVRTVSSMEANIVRSDQDAQKIAIQAKRVAVLGIKTEAQASQPAFFVPEYLQSVGVDIVPVPVYYPEVKEILGKPVVRDLRQIQGHIDILDVFRRPADLPGHLDDIVALRPDCVWLQSGIRWHLPPWGRPDVTADTPAASLAAWEPLQAGSHPEFEERLAAAGIKVVPSRCLKVDRAAAGGRSAL